MNDRLEEILRHQQAFHIQRKKFTGELPVVETKELLLWMHAELSELLQALNVKVYSTRENGYNLSNVKDEIMDVFKYSLVLMNIWDMDAEEIVEEYYRKSKVVEHKWMQDIDLLMEGESLVCVDIDGVLCNFIQTWSDFLVMNGALMDPIVSHIYSDLSEYLPQPIKKEYSNLKAEYRESGIKRNAAVFPGAKEFLHRLRQKYKVVLVTARPAHKHRRIFADTVEWLESNGLEYDALIFEENKREWVLSHSENISFCVEDDVRQTEDLTNVGIKTYLVDHLYNRNIHCENAIRVDSLEKIEC